MGTDRIVHFTNPPTKEQVIALLDEYLLVPGRWQTVHRFIWVPIAVSAPADATWTAPWGEAVPLNEAGWEVHYVSDADETFVNVVTRNDPAICKAIADGFAKQLLQRFGGTIEHDMLPNLPQRFRPAVR